MMLASLDHVITLSSSIREMSFKVSDLLIRIKRGESSAHEKLKLVTERLAKETAELNKLVK